MHVRKLKTIGSIITSLFNILYEQKRFYQELYKARLMLMRKLCLATNTFLKRIKVLEDNKCTLCHSELESLLH